MGSPKPLSLENAGSSGITNGDGSHCVSLHPVIYPTAPGGYIGKHVDARAFWFRALLLRLSQYGLSCKELEQHAAASRSRELILVKVGSRPSTT